MRVASRLVGGAACLLPCLLSVALAATHVAAADATNPQNMAAAAGAGPYQQYQQQWPIQQAAAAPSVPSAAPAQNGYNAPMYPAAGMPPQTNAAMAQGMPGATGPYQGYYQGSDQGGYAPGQMPAPNMPVQNAVDATSPAARIAALEARVAYLQQQGPGVSQGPETTPMTPGAAVPETTTPGGGNIVANNAPMAPRWDNGLILESKNKDFIIRVGGRTQVDTGFFGASSSLVNTPIGKGGVGNVEDSTELRRARLRVEGTMWEVVGWAAEYDFSNAANVSNIPGNPPGFPSSVQGTGFPTPGNQGPLAIVPSITDLYVTVTKMPIGNFRVGNFKEPIGLEHLTSSRWLDFMERSPNQDSFYGPFNNGFMPGMMLFNWSENELMTWALWMGPNNSNIFAYHIGNDYAGTGA